MANKKIVRLTESDLIRLVRKVMAEQVSPGPINKKLEQCAKKHFKKPDLKLPEACHTYMMKTITMNEQMGGILPDPTDMMAFKDCGLALVKMVGGDVYSVFESAKKILECAAPGKVMY
jgi:hypothetical protein